MNKRENDNVEVNKRKMLIHTKLAEIIYVLYDK